MDDIARGSKQALLEKLDSVLVDVFERLVERANGAPIIVPLSGGYDSRLIALMLTRLDYDNLFSYTYSSDFLTEDDCSIAREIASDLGLEWVPLELTEEDFRNYYRSEEYAVLRRTVEDYSTVKPLLFWMTCMQKMKHSHQFPDSGIITKGHGVVATGSYLPRNIAEEERLSIEETVDLIWKKHYSMRHLENKRIEESMRERIRSRIDASTVENATDAIEQWHWRERASKFLIRHIGGHRYWGYDRWLPFWDSELIAFWSSVPVKHRVNKRLYREYVERLYEEMCVSPWQIAGKGNVRQTTFSLLSVLDTIITNVPFESTIRDLYLRSGTHRVRSTPSYARYAHLSSEQFERLYPRSRHPHYFHALDTLVRIGCCPSNEHLLYEDIRLYEKL